MISLCICVWMARFQHNRVYIAVWYEPTCGDSSYTFIHSVLFLVSQWYNEKCCLIMLSRLKPWLKLNNDLLFSFNPLASSYLNIDWYLSFPQLLIFFPSRRCPRFCRVHFSFLFFFFFFFFAFHHLLLLYSFCMCTANKSRSESLGAFLVLGSNVLPFSHAFLLFL